MFWKKFVKLCNQNGTNPTAVVVSLNISRGSVTGWKKGSVPSDITVQKIADYFGVTPEYLLSETEEKGSPSAELPKGLDKLGVEILTLFSELPEEKKAEARSYLEFLVQKEKQDN